MQEAFDRLQRARFNGFIWFAVILVLITTLLMQWSRVSDKADQTIVKVTVRSFYESASSLRQLWELNDKPEVAESNGITFGFTALGWPVVIRGGNVNCKEMWDLLSNNSQSASYIDLFDKKTLKSAPYNSCIYQISDGRWLELFYENETIHINGILTQ
ncbi:hypothetical protein [Photobacterium sagamiensis]|uniref:hypothetical protein n=1 Tax=Photobacterium sagamiensis TaxID=2910241 RepID=UPI003D0E6A78